MLVFLLFSLLLAIPLSNGSFVSGGFSYNLNALSGFPYRRLTIPYQHSALLDACTFLQKYTPDIMVADCSLEQLFATDDLVVAGLLMANQTDDLEKQAAGYALLDQVSSVVFSGTPMLPLNDIWGYNDPISGRSYALIGASNGVHIVDVTVPLSPVSVFFYQGSYSLWRDIKVWNSTLYAVNDNNFGSLFDQFSNVNQSYIDPWLQRDGLVIIDLTYALQPHFFNKTNQFFYTAHNIQVEFDWTNTTAPCTWCRPLTYVVGHTVPGWSGHDVRSFGGFVVLDLADRLNPVQIGQWNETYIHDIVIQYREDEKKYIGYAAAIYSIAGQQKGVYIIDVTDPSNPVTLASYMASYNYTHNSWPTDDGKFLYVTHETENAPVTIWNITDLYNVKEIGAIFITPENKNILAHNVLVRGNRLWISYYAMGSAVYDITDPVNPVLIGIYDTSPDISSGMGGTWGIYPYADNYMVYASDMSNGMYVLNLTSTPLPPVPEDKLLPGVLAFIILSAIIHAATIIAFVVFAKRALPYFRYATIKDNVSM